ncbi:MAG: hypothetical protein LQ340_002606 [Diploschistes diacapsis]|nr:MAG: hypothetical protein LQ340_002606 [Diploschistes diacapsis]
MQNVIPIARPASTSSRLAPAVFNPTSQPSVRALQADDTVVHHYRQGRPRCFWTRTARQAETAKFGSLTEQEYQNHPSKFRELPHSKLKTVFGPAIGKSTGNNLLRTLQKQRITGTLDQDINEKYVTPELVAQGLLWLRQNYKLDEDAAIIKRIQQENKQMEEKFIADVKYVPQQRAAEEGIYGKSRFEELRKANRAKAAAKEKQAEEIKKAHGNTTVVSNAKGHAVLAGRTESAEWVKRYKERAALSKMLEPPQMSLTKRLLPSTVFAALFLIICFTFASNYTPPIKEARIFPNTPPAAATEQYYDKLVRRRKRDGMGGMRANIDHFSHLGGYFIGIWSAGALTWKAENQSARETSRKSAELERQERELVERRKAEWRAPPPVDKKEIVR